MADIKQATTSGADIVLCTEKDAARIKTQQYFKRDAWNWLAAITCDVRIVEGEPALQRRVDDVLCSR